jgi:hypothetical protein
LHGEGEDFHHHHHYGHGNHHGNHENHHPHHEEVWNLNVQGVVIESRKPEIAVREVIQEAGFNPDTPWIIILKVAGEPKREVDLSFVIDLRHKGIEKLRLTPRQTNNGEMLKQRRAAFAMLPQDAALLDRLRVDWETLVDAGRRWLVVRNYPLPRGYQVATAMRVTAAPILASSCGE